jgi:tetratricopeptide (TPR) repeat protein
VLAWLGPDDVPRDLITALTDGDQTAADIALGLLASYSMITLDTYTVSIHRLLQTVLRLTPSAASSTTASSERAIQLLSDAIPDDPGGDPAGWPRWRDLLPHVTALGDFLPDSTDTTLGRLLNHAATFERRQGLHQQAKLHDRQALSIAEAALGPDHPDVAICLNNLASSYFDLGRAADAVPLLLRALKITEATLGRDHPDVAIRLGNLANSYRNLGRAADSVPLEQRALTITATALGSNHPTVAVRLNNLAHSYRNLGRAADAVPLFLRALKITETALGLNHPDVAICLNNLASSYLDLGRAAEAVPLFRRALKITETALGPNHPDVAIRLSNLAASYVGLGRATDALALCRRAVQIADQTMPDGHPIAVSLHAFLKRLKQEKGRARRG